MPDIYSRLETSGLTVPEPVAPIASYVPCASVHSGSMVYVSGQIPMAAGKLLATGKVPGEVSLESAQACARQCVLNALGALEAELGSLHRLRRVIRLRCYVACEPSFTDHSKVANGASDLLQELLDDNGRHARAAVGVTSLPLDAPVEIEFAFLVD